MFVLRRIIPDGSESNTCLGETYNYVRKVENEKEYESTLKAWLQGLKRDDEDVYGFVVHNGGQTITPLYKRSVYFVMMSNGQTFANISER
jgi:hypothetical protein